MSSTCVDLLSVVWFKYVSFVCALMCLPHGLVCDLWYNFSMCLLSVRLCVFHMCWSVIGGMVQARVFFVRLCVFYMCWSVVCGMLQVRVFSLCANVSSIWVGL